MYFFSITQPRADALATGVAPVIKNTFFLALPLPVISCVCEIIRAESATTLDDIFVLFTTHDVSSTPCTITCLAHTRCVCRKTAPDTKPAETSSRRRRNERQKHNNYAMIWLQLGGFCTRLLELQLVQAAAASSDKIY